MTILRGVTEPRAIVRGAIVRGAGSPTPPSYTYATWNPADKDALIDLSGGDLSVARPYPSDGHIGVRATIGLTAGKWFYCSEVVGITNTIAIGVALASATLSSYLGYDANGWSYYGANGNKTNNGSGAAYGATFVSGDTVGVGIDADARTMEGFILSGGAWVSQGLIDISGLVGTLYPAVSVYAGSPGYPGVSAIGDAIVSNFGATAFPAAAPAGYNSGVYTV